jgi:hypothetical protein
MNGRSGTQPPVGDSLGSIYPSRAASAIRRVLIIGVLLLAPGAAFAAPRQTGDSAANPSTRAEMTAGPGRLIVIGPGAVHNRHRHDAAADVPLADLDSLQGQAATASYGGREIG